MNAPELVAAAILAGFGVRSLVHWARRPFESADLTDQVLYAVYLTGRVGLWFAFAGLFAIFATITTRGQAFVDDVAGFRWYVVVIGALGAMQLVAGWFLGHRGGGGEPPA
ncbi:MAG: hypothetical protein ACM3OO_05635 [Planctomycetaceae bacterium]